MDELLHHCLRELSFDGDFGCSVGRLKDFIIDFYAQGSRGQQNTDDAFCSFIWSLIVQQPTVLVGTKPSGVTEQVWIAPQQKTARKAKAEGEDPVATSSILRLDLVPPDAASRPLHELVAQYGETLRIALKPDAIYSAITGTHIKFSKLSPMVYSALQIITRGRETGVTVVQLGKESSYDQKTCFYLVKQLTDLNLVVKVRRGGVGSHFCIHKYFFERSPIWSAIREEEGHANESDDDITQRPDMVEEEEDDGQPVSTIGDLNFSPIDARHLSSLPLVRSRVTRLLKSSTNQIHASNNMIKAIGFQNPTKTDRRFFQSRMRELLSQGIVEYISVPNKSRSKSPKESSMINCYRLVSKQDSTSSNVDEASSVERRKDGNTEEERSKMIMTLTIHKQVANLLEEAGTAGMTLNEITTTLLQFDKRTVELLLTRAEKIHPPPHLRDLSTVALMETSGRERRNRYYTLANYRKLVAQENLHDSTHSSVDLTSCGGFLEIQPGAFYDDVETLRKYQDRGQTTVDTKPSRSRKRTNPVLPDGQVKQGRPRKHPYDEHGNVLVGRLPKKRKRAEGEVDAEGPPRKRGRPKKDPNIAPEDKVAPKKKRTRKGDESGTEAVPPPPRKRARQMGTIPDELAPPTPPPIILTPTPVAPATPSLLPRRHPPPELPTAPPDASSSTFAQPPNGEMPPSLQLAHADQGTKPPPIDMDAMIPIDPQLLGADASKAPSPSPQPAKKGKKQSAPDKGPSKVKSNVSYLRRENEFLRVLEEAGGIISILSREMADAHSALIERLAVAGEPTSAPVGTKTDKRTTTACFAGLENRGKVTLLRTVVQMMTGNPRPTVIAHFPNLDQTKISKYLIDLGKATPQPTTLTKKVDQALEFSPAPKTTQKAQRAAKRSDKGPALEGEATLPTDDTAVRDILLTERTTYCQFYGFILARGLRCRQLHLVALKSMESKQSSLWIISHQNRILHLSYFFQDITLGQYCSLVSPLRADDVLTKYLFEENGRDVVLRDLPQNIRDLLSIGRARSRSRVLDILSTLQSLGVVTPLAGCASENAAFTCPSSGDHPAYYAPIPSIAPNNVVSAIYWHFNCSVPLHYLAARSEDPPLLAKLPITSSEDAILYWQQLQDACRTHDLEVVAPPPDATSGRILPFDASTRRSLRRRQAWSSQYDTTWNQAKYLERYVDRETGNCPLQDDDGGVAHIKRISWVISSPYEAVVSHLQQRRKEVLRDVKKGQRAERLSKEEALAKASLVKMAEEGQQEKARRWDELVKKAVEAPDVLSKARLSRLRSQYMKHSIGNDLERWESEINKALKEAQGVGLSVLRKKSQKKSPPAPRAVASTSPPSNGPPHVNNPPERDIRELIMAQGAPLPQPTPKKKKKGKAVEASEPRPAKRRKFLWSADYEELLRDASVIIRSRCRETGRLDWGAFAQVFPALPRNTVRQRLGPLREGQGEEHYLKRLENEWHALWLKFRGTEFLADEDVRSPSNFDLVAHITFLRRHIDKNALRTGLPQHEDGTHATLPATVDDLHVAFSTVVSQRNVYGWDFMWTNAQEESREKRSFEISTLSFPQDPVESPSATEAELLAEAAVKMTFGAPDDTYEAPVGEMVLNSIGEELVEVATKNLLARGVLSRKDSKKSLPGRKIRISDANIQAIGGSLPADLFGDADSYESTLVDNELNEWSLQAPDGDVAALLELVSEGQVEFTVDTSGLLEARRGIDWSSKRADDDDNETAIQIQYRPNHSIAINEQYSILEGISSVGGVVDDMDHGTTEDGGPACCQHEKVPLVDCAACLKEVLKDVDQSTPSHTRDLCHKILSIVRTSGESGVKKSALMQRIDAPRDQMSAALCKLTRAAVPLLHWVGYRSIVLVHACYLAHWSVLVGQDPFHRVFPRRWLDIHGAVINSAWDAGVRAIMGIVVFHPGISLREIRWRLRSVYDRQELCDLVRSLLSRRMLSLEKEGPWLDDDAPLDNQEEVEVSVHLGDRSWFNTL